MCPFFHFPHKSYCYFISHLNYYKFKFIWCGNFHDRNLFFSKKTHFQIFLYIWIGCMISWSELWYCRCSQDFFRTRFWCHQFLILSRCCFCKVSKGVNCVHVKLIVLVLLWLYFNGCRFTFLLLFESPLCQCKAFTDCTNQPLCCYVWIFMQMLIEVDKWQMYREALQIESAFNVVFRPFSAV